MELYEGEFVGYPRAPEYGVNPKNGKKEIRLYMEIADGPLAGRRIKYTANTKDAAAVAYAKRDLKAAGWQGRDIATFVSDVTKAADVKVPFTTRLASATRDDGSTNQWWTVGSIGTGATPLVAASRSDDEQVNSWFAEVDEPQPRQSAGNQGYSGDRGRGGHSGGYGGYPSAPGSRDDAPFAPIPRRI